jgi:hypothetical protein
MKVELTWPSRFKQTKAQTEWFDRISAVEPNLTIQELADRIGASYAIAQRWAKYFGYPLRHGGTKVNIALLDNVDWNRSDSSIALDLNLSRTRVNQIRHELHAKKHNGIDTGADV